MNTDKIYAEQLANKYAPKDTTKVVALRKLDTKAKLPATVFTTHSVLSLRWWLVLGMDKSYDRMFRHVFTPIPLRMLQV